MSEGKKVDRKPRRNWPKSLKRQIVEESNEPGVSVCEVARRYDLDPGQLFQWRKKFGFGATGDAGAAEIADFVAVEVSEEPSAEKAEPEDNVGASFRFEIAFPNGRHLFVPADTSPEHLRSMIAAVEAS